jgi:hypothetical protein
VISPTQISRFLGLGELYVHMDPGTDQLCTWGLGHIQEHVKLYILSGGQCFIRGSWPFGAGVWEFPHTNFEIFVFGGTIWTNRSSYSQAMAMGVPPYSRGRQTTYCIQWLALLDEI